MKNPLTPIGIEPATFRFVAKHLNHSGRGVSLIAHLHLVRSIRKSRVIIFYMPSRREHRQPSHTNIYYSNGTTTYYVFLPLSVRRHGNFASMSTDSFKAHQSLVLRSGCWKSGRKSERREPKMILPREKKINAYKQPKMFLLFRPTNALYIYIHTHITTFVSIHVPCILYCSLFRPTNRPYIYIQCILYTRQTNTLYIYIYIYNDL